MAKVSHCGCTKISETPISLNFTFGMFSRIPSTVSKSCKSSTAPFGPIPATPGTLSAANGAIQHSRNKNNVTHRLRHMILPLMPTMRWTPPAEPWQIALQISYKCQMYRKRHYCRDTAYCRDSVSRYLISLTAGQCPTAKGVEHGLTRGVSY